MCTVTETQLQGHTLLVNTINKDTCILLIYPIQQKIVSDDKWNTKDRQRSQRQQTVKQKVGDFIIIK